MGSIKLLMSSLFVYMRLSMVILLVVPPLLVVLLVTPTKKCKTSPIVFYLLHIVYRGGLWAARQPFTLVGVEHIPNEPAIIAVNHESAIDIPLAGVIMQKKPHTWYALAYFASKPVLGFFVRKLCITLERDRAGSAALDFRRGMRQTASYPGHTLIFPEGTRYTDGQVHAFLRGFAILARKVQRPVIPVFMPYNGMVYPPGSFYVYPHRLLVIVGEPLRIEEHESIEAFVQRVERWFVDQEQKLGRMAEVQAYKKKMETK